MTQDVFEPSEAAAISQDFVPESDPDFRETSSRQLTDESSALQVAQADGSEAAKISGDMSAAVSQPMTASTSTSSNPSLKDNGTGTASPYGTRSRNRGGASRPNYAEDRETEMDFEIQTPAKDDDSRKTARSTEPRPATTVEAARPSSASRKQPTAQLEYNGTGQSTAKDHIPGTSTFSANPAVASSMQPSKKRKATSQSAATALNQQSSAITSALGGQTVTRRASIAAQAQSAYRDSSMLSFDNCSAHLKDGRLVADDGTTLEINGV